MSKIDLTVVEIVSMIKRSGVINIVIEGRDDIIAYRHIESALNMHASIFISLVPAGGREKVLAIYDILKRDNALDKCYFICDQDIWLYSGIPEAYIDQRIVKTNGFSIENDLLRDYDISRLLSEGEAIKFNIELDIFRDWFAFALSKVLAGEDQPISCHVNEIIDSDRDRPAVIQAKTNDPGMRSLLKKISLDDAKFLRGKSYLSLYLRQLSERKRKVKHSTLSIFEHASAARGENLMNIESNLLQLMNEELPNSVRVAI